MSIPEELIEVREHTAEGYSPVVDYSAWRVAVLNFCDTLLPERLTEMQRHNETDEVFVLLRGSCILFVGSGDDNVNEIFAEDMQPHKVYNVRKSTWHTHTLSKEAMVLVVENRDTTFDNSPFTPLTDAQQKTIIRITDTLWGND